MGAKTAIDYDASRAVNDPNNPHKDCNYVQSELLSYCPPEDCLFFYSSRNKSQTQHDAPTDSSTQHYIVSIDWSSSLPLFCVSLR